MNALSHTIWMGNFSFHKDCFQKQTFFHLLCSHGLLKNMFTFLKIVIYNEYYLYKYKPL